MFTIPLTQYLTAVLVVIFAAGLSTFIWWIARTWDQYLRWFLALFAFGVVLIFIKVT